MSKNEFLPFGTAEGANVLSPEEYQYLQSRLQGFMSGVARSAELNTVWRQSSVMAAAIAQLIVDNDDKDVLDDGDFHTLKNRIESVIEKISKGVQPLIAQETGDSTDVLMSQKAVTDAISDSQVNVPNASESIMGKVKISSDPENKSTETAASTELLQKTNQSTNAIINKQYVTTTVPPDLPSINNTSLKLFIKNLGINVISDYYVVSKKANGSRGYVAMGITNFGTAPDDANTGGGSPIRPSEVLSLTEVYVGYFTPSHIIGDVTVTDFVPETLRKMYGIKCLLRPERLMIYNKGTGGISFSNPQCYHIKSQSAVIYPIMDKDTSLHLGTSSGSSDSILISTSIDGVNFVPLKTLNLKTATAADVGYYKLNLEMDVSPKGYVKIENTSPSSTVGVYVMGLNIKPLEDCTIHTQYDCVMLGGDGTLDNVANKYQNGAGANEFAARQDGGKWFGTYHGGHVNFLQRIKLSSSRYNVDTDYSSLPDCELSNAVEILSISDIEVSGTTYSYTSSTVYGEGAHVTNVTIELKSGSAIKCVRAFVNMCCTAPNFNWVHHPVLLKDISTNQDITIGQTGFVEQYQAGTTKTLRNYFSQVPMINNIKNGCYISYQNVYNKVYYGLILDKPAEFFGGNFITCKTYS